MLGVATVGSCRSESAVHPKFKVRVSKKHSSKSQSQLIMVTMELKHTKFQRHFVSPLLYLSCRRPDCILHPSSLRYFSNLDDIVGSVFGIQVNPDLTQQTDHGNGFVYFNMNP